MFALILNAMITGEIEKHDILAKGSATFIREKFRMVSGKSIFCDVGSGLGRPTLIAAHLPIHASLGFDIVPEIVVGSISAWDTVRRVDDKLAPIGFFVQNALMLDSLTPATHVYSFIAHAPVIDAIARLSAASETVKLVCVVVTMNNLVIGRPNGLYDATDTDIIKIHGITMTGGGHHPGFIIPMTSKRRQRIRSIYATHQGTSGDLTDAFQTAGSYDAFYHRAMSALPKKEERKGRRSAPVSYAQPETPSSSEEDYLQPKDEDEPMPDVVDLIDSSSQ